MRNDLQEFLRTFHSQLLKYHALPQIGDGDDGTIECHAYFLWSITIFFTDAPAAENGPSIFVRFQKLFQRPDETEGLCVFFVHMIYFNFIIYVIQDVVEDEMPEIEEDDHPIGLCVCGWVVHMENSLIFFF